MTRLLRFALPAYLVAEAFVALQLAASIGAARTLLLLLLSAAAGVWVLRREQLEILRRLRRSVMAGQPARGGLFDGAARAAAGILLIIPGFISDAAALALLVPGVRRWLARRLTAAIGANPAAPIVIEGDYHRLDDPALTKPTREAR